MTKRSQHLRRKLAKEFEVLAAIRACRSASWELVGFRVVFPMKPEELPL